MEPVPCFGHRFKPIATESCTGNRRDGRSGDRENPFGASYFQVRAFDWNPPRRALGPAANRPGHVTVPDQCRKPSENSCQGAVHTLTQSRSYYRGGRRAAAIVAFGDLSNILAILHYGARGAAETPAESARKMRVIAKAAGVGNLAERLTRLHQCTAFDQMRSVI